jgi:tellurite resistance protein TerC
VFASLMAEGASAASAIPISETQWAASIGLILALLVVIQRFDHNDGSSNTYTAIAMTIYLSLAALFALGVFVVNGPGAGMQFCASWLTEIAMSVDNLFVYLMIMTRFEVPLPFQNRVLTFGIYGSLFFRLLFAAAVGGWVLHSLAAIVPGAAMALMWLGFKSGREALSKEEPQDITHSKLYRLVVRVLPFTWERGHGPVFRTRVLVKGQRRRAFTYLLPALVLITGFGLLFGLDSAFAAYGVSSSVYLVCMSTVFAMLGLRSMYFGLAAIAQRLTRLSLAVSVVIVMAGVLMMLESNFDLGLFSLPGTEVPIWVTMSLLLLVLGVGVLASLIWPDTDAIAHARELRDRLMAVTHHASLSANRLGATALVILMPDDTVKSMLDEHRHGTVRETAQTVRNRLAGLDKNGVIPEIPYGTDLLGAVRRVLQISADSLDGSLFAIVTDGLVVDKASRELIVQMLGQLRRDDRVLIARTDDQGHEHAEITQWLRWLDHHSPVAHRVSVKTAGVLESGHWHAEIASWYRPELWGEAA